MLRYIKILIILLFISPILYSQKLVNSPYARFGAGTLEPKGSLKVLSMGGAGTALGDPLNINYSNPASYSKIDTNCFIFDFGFDYRIMVLDDGTKTDFSEDLNFRHLAMAFPVGKRMGFAVGVMPYSSGYYNIINTTKPGDTDFDPLIGETEERHRGVGGYNNIFWGIGISPIKNLSIGANMTFLLGEINRENVYLFLDDNNHYNTFFGEDVKIRGFAFDYGVQYTKYLKNDFYTTAGFTFTGSKKYKAETKSITSRYSIYTGSEWTIDTLAYNENLNNSITLPQVVSFGLVIGKKDHFSIVADYSMTNWSESIFFGYESYFSNSNTIRFGAEFIPDKSANFNIFNRIEYRAGGHITDSHIMVNNEQLKEFGITFGAGIPLNKTKSRINIYFEYGNRSGSFENGLHIETYYNAGMSFNFYDYWFFKKEYK
ncbi:MAG: hypothetical protein K8R35_01260 [Bacteroidales bacterium]|nr:hypothetical protein [Bacteroidales bacterium]